MEVFQRFRNYFQAISNAFDDEEECSKIFKNNVDAGSTREDIFAEFLKRHLPLRTNVIKGGFIFDSSGNESKQIDLIIINDGTVQFKQFSNIPNGGKSFSIIEGCYGAISVKTELTKKELIDSLKNLASIPQMTDNVSINPSLKSHETVKDFPIGIIFAFTGMNVETTLQHLEEYYISNSGIPNNRKPTFIIVNNKYIIRYTGKKGISKRDGTMTDPDVFYPMTGSNYIGGYSLWYLITEIAGAVSFGPHMIINLEPYTIKMAETMD